MSKEKYTTVASKDWLSYEFISEGPKGRIKKLIIYQKLHEELYNLAFGDASGKEGDIDDMIISDNKDSEKVLATVAATIFDFFSIYKGTLVIAKGSTKSRTILYRRYLSHFLDEINKDLSYSLNLKATLNVLNTTKIILLS